MDSVSPETPIRDVVDRCRVWESHADPAVRRIGKPNPDPTYPTYAVGDADSDHARPRDLGGGKVSTVSPRRTIIDDVSQTVEQSGGGGDLSWFPPEFRQCGLKRPRLRTLDVSVLMMLLDYDRIRALCGCRMIVCL